MVNNKKELTDLIKQLEESIAFGKYNKDEIAICVPKPSDVIAIFGEDIEAIKLANPIVGEDVEIYPKYIIEARVSVDIPDMGDMYATVGILINKDKATIYSGATARACLNLSIFGAEYVTEVPFDTIESIEQLIETAKKNVFKQVLHILELKKDLEAVVFSEKEFTLRVGSLLLRNLPIELMEYLVHAAAVLRDESSIYFEEPLTDWLLLSAMTDKVKDKASIMNRVKTTMALENVFTISE
jgi:hypothetical protein